MFKIFLAIAVLATLPSLTIASDIAQAVVRIMATSQHPDYRQPWTGGKVGRSTGSGFVVAGNRIITNAHVVSNARFLALTREGDPQVYTARVKHVAHDCDLAMLEVDDQSFFENTGELSLGGIPAIESVVSVYGYPIGGDRLSVTQGIVSRIDFQPYSHSGIDSHLTIQIDAAINPGNSGGPVLQDGLVVGVAFQGYSGDIAQNTGYMIPTPVVQRFLTDVEDGTYDRYVDIALSYHPLHNLAMREALGLPNDHRGVYVGQVFEGGSSDGLIMDGDVLLEVDGLPIASDGTVPLDGRATAMSEVVERKFRGDEVTFKVLREGQLLDVVVPLNRPWPFSLQANAYDEQPRFHVYGGLVFQPVDANFMRSHAPGNMRLKYFYDHFISHDIHRDHPEIVVLSNILNDPVNAYAGGFRHEIVDRVNGVKINKLDDLVAALQKEGDFTVIEMVGPSRPLILDREAIKGARERIAQRYGVRQQTNLKP